jgi:two-component system sensor histidine kinase VicK
MISLRGNEAGPKGLVGLSILIVLLAIGSVGLFGVIENARVKDAAEGAIAYDVAVAEAGDNLRVAVLDVRHAHRNIAFSGESETTVADFDASYATLLREIDRLEEIGVEQLDVIQPAEFRTQAQAYHDAFRPSIVLFTSDPIAFNEASEIGLDQLDQLETEAIGIDEAGEALTSNALERVEEAADRERIILIALLIGVALIGIALSIGAGRVLDQLRTANSQTQEANQRLAAALQTKNDFIADASHELRTPLTLIRGNAEIGLAAADGDDHRQVLGEILGESKRMSRLVDDLLFLARSDAGVPPVDREYVPVRWLVNRIAGPAEALARHHDRCLNADLQGQGHIEADPERIQQAVMILLDNAAKFTPAGECVLLRSATDGGTLSIAVADAGPGIPEEEQALVFERFYQVGPGRTRTRGGTGLGLAIAKSIIDAHAGEIGIESAPGKGTTMTIRLPLSRES